MQFVLTEIVARLVALYLCVDSIRCLRAFAERKIEYIETDVINMLPGWSNRIAHRDTMPVRYWGIVTGHVTAVAACLVVVIFGWWLPVS